MTIKYLGKCLLVEEKGKKIIVIGDLHFGFEESLNKAGVFVSRKMFEEMIEELDRVFAKIGGVDEVVLLGDVKHEFGEIMRQEWKDTIDLFEYLEGKMKKEGKITIVKGNHDAILEPIANEGKKVELRDYYCVGETCFLHGHRDFEEIHNKEFKVWVMGHVHPAVKISDGVKIEKYKCFLTGKFEGKKIIIVPSFLDYSEGTDPRENFVELPWKIDLERFDVKIIGENLEVLDFGKLEEI